MTEEEILINIKEMINICDSLPNEGCTAHIISHDHFKAVKGLLDLYNKQKEEIKELNLENQAFYEEMNCDDNEYISKKYSQLKSVVEILANGIRVLGTNPDITTEEIIKEFIEKPITEEYMEEFKSRYISKDKIREYVNSPEFLDWHLGFTLLDELEYRKNNINKLLEEN